MNLKLYLSVILILSLTACGQKTAETVKTQAKQDTLIKPVASIQEIMQSIVDPNIDYVWNSVSSVSTKKSLVEKKPVTDEDWKLVRQHALVVVEVPNLLLIEGRHAAAEGSTTSAAPAELEGKEIEKLIAANRGEYNQFVLALRNAVQQTLVAIDAKNTDQLVSAGGDVDKVCEACHKRFWYPNDKRPGEAGFPGKS
jgi:cytochrome c556